MTEFLMRGGGWASDARLGRVASFDARSRDYPIRALLAPAASPRSYTWRLGTHLDQGRTSACTGFSLAHELAARPVVVPVDEALAQAFYVRARQLDEWPGEEYDGSSVLGAVKGATEGGFYSEYRWAFGLDDLVLAVGHHGPAILGINWYQEMFRPDVDGLLHVAGAVAGGHAILCSAVSVKRERFWLSNSWGLDWGLSGGAWVSFEDMGRLLREDGEACIPVKRGRGRLH